MLVATFLLYPHNQVPKQTELRRVASEGRKLLNLCCRDSFTFLLPSRSFLTFCYTFIFLTSSLYF